MLNKALVGWKLRLSELSKQNTLYKCLKTEYQGKHLKILFKTFRLFTDYRLEKKGKDYVMTKQIESLRRKSFVSKWKRALSQRTGSKFIDFLMIRHRQGEFFKRTRALDKFNEEAVRHMEIFRLYKLQEFTFNGLKENVEGLKRRIWA